MEPVNEVSTENELADFFRDGPCNNATTKDARRTAPTWKTGLTRCSLSLSLFLSLSLSLSHTHTHTHIVFSVDRACDELRSRYMVSRREQSQEHTPHHHFAHLVRLLAAVGCRGRTNERNTTVSARQFRRFRLLLFWNFSEKNKRGRIRLCFGQNSRKLCRQQW